MKLITIIGARPQFVKAAAVSRAFQLGNKIKEIIIHTGQHHDENMSDVFFKELEIPKPIFNLAIHGGSHGQMTGRMLEGIEKVLIAEEPDCVLVYGDTNSTLAGSIAASKLHIPVAHVEAGLRSFNKKMPEEINRILTDQVSNILFTPTSQADLNLKNEGVAQSKIFNVGDVMFDAALYFGERAQNKSIIIEKLKLVPKKYILATVHRAENTDDPNRLKAIFQGLQKISKEMIVVFPLHPRTKQLLVKENLIDQSHQNLKLVDPVGYLDMLQLEKNAALIATDSGGVQKEAFFYEVPCVTLRDQTEWIELVALGWNTLVKVTSSEVVKNAILENLGRQGQKASPYGQGQSSQKINDILSQQ